VGSPSSGLGRGHTIGLSSAIFIRLPGDEEIESGVGADVENVLAGLERAQGERVADAGEGFDGTVGKRVNDGAGIAQACG
jgi:hypothetical protein